MLSSIFGNVSQSLAQNLRLALVPRDGGSPLKYITPNVRLNNSEAGKRQLSCHEHEAHKFMNFGNRRFS